MVADAGPARQHVVRVDRDDDRLERVFSAGVVFCFAMSEDAEAFAKRFGGERLPTGSRR